MAVAFAEKTQSADQGEPKGEPGASAQSFVHQNKIGARFEGELQGFGFATIQRAEQLRSWLSLQCFHHEPGGGA